jgi:hypothetical protein
MALYYVPLRFSPSGKWLCLRSLCGHDELAVEQPGTLDAIRLLDRLLVELPDGSMGMGSSRRIVTADRDRAMAAIYKHTFGARIESTIACTGCASPFDLEFSLDELLAHHDSQTDMAGVEEVERGIYKLLSGQARFRLPMGDDEMAVFGLPSEESEKTFLERCLMEGDPASESKNVQQAMQAIAPVFATELAANCPECGHQQAVHFDMQAFLLSAVISRRKLLIKEVHRLAKSYGWSHGEILDLPGNLRRNYVELVESEFEAS